MMQIDHKSPPWGGIQLPTATQTELPAAWRFFTAALCLVAGGVSWLQVGQEWMSDPQNGLIRVNNKAWVDTGQ